LFQAFLFFNDPVKSRLLQGRADEGQAGAQQKVAVIEQQGPGKTIGGVSTSTCLSRCKKASRSATSRKIFFTLDPAHDDVLKRSGSVDSGFA
jgi:hypothetical protein